jgi:hypothetical protein
VKGGRRNSKGVQRNGGEEDRRKEERGTERMTKRRLAKWLGERIAAYRRATEQLGGRAMEWQMRWMEWQKRTVAEWGAGYKERLGCEVK